MREICDKVWNYYIDNIYTGEDIDLHKIQDCREWLENIDLFDLAEIIPEYCDYKDPDDVEAAAEEILSMMLTGLDKAEEKILHETYI